MKRITFSTDAPHSDVKFCHVLLSDLLKRAGVKTAIVPHLAQAVAAVALAWGDGNYDRAENIERNAAEQFAAMFRWMNGDAHAGEEKPVINLSFISSKSHGVDPIRNTSKHSRNPTINAIDGNVDICDTAHRRNSMCGVTHNERKTCTMAHVPEPVITMVPVTRNDPNEAKKTSVTDTLLRPVSGENNEIKHSVTDKEFSQIKSHNHIPCMWHVHLLEEFDGIVAVHDIESAQAVALTKLSPVLLTIKKVGTP